MDLKDKIKVMQHFAEGGKVEYRRQMDSEWQSVDKPCWDWSIVQFRIRQSPITAGHNPHNLTEDQVECDKGWRLLQEHEIKSNVDTRRNELPPNVLQMWLPEDERWDLEFRPGGNDRSCTYRTLLYPADLAKYDIKPKTKQPLTAADFPPGTVVKWADASTDSWFLVLYVGGLSISIQSRSTLLYTDLLAQWQYSTDQGKTWLPCYKEV
jgi:hypothetical protein